MAKNRGNRNMTTETKTEEQKTTEVVETTEVQEEQKTEAPATEPVKAEEPAVAEAVVETTDSTQPVKEEVSEDLIPLTDEMTPAERSLAASLNTYYANMGGSAALSLDHIVRHQTRLIGSIRAALSNPNQDIFRKQWMILITAFREGRKPKDGIRQAFKEELVMRAIEEVPAPGPKFQQNVNLINLLLATAGSKNIKDVSRLIDIRKTFEGMGEVELNRLTEIYVD